MKYFRDFLLKDGSTDCYFFYLILKSIDSHYFVTFNTKNLILILFIQNKNFEIGWVWLFICAFAIWTFIK